MWMFDVLPDIGSNSISIWHLQLAIVLQTPSNLSVLVRRGIQWRFLVHECGLSPTCWSSSHATSNFLLHFCFVISWTLVCAKAVQTDVPVSLQNSCFALQRVVFGIFFNRGSFLWSVYWLQRNICFENSLMYVWVGSLKIPIFYGHWSLFVKSSKFWLVVMWIPNMRCKACWCQQNSLHDK